MAGNRKGVYPTSGKRRKSYYEFSRDYPGTGYEKNNKRSTSASMDNKKRVKIALFIVFIIAVVALGYFITYTCLSISNEPIKAADDYLSVSDESTTLYIDNGKDLTTTQSTTSNETTTSIEEHTTDTINE